MESGSRKPDAASRNETPWFFRFAAALPAFHSNLNAMAEHYSMGSRP